MRRSVQYQQYHDPISKYGGNQPQYFQHQQNSWPEFSQVIHPVKPLPSCISLVDTLLRDFRRFSNHFLYLSTTHEQLNIIPLGQHCLEYKLLTELIFETAKQDTRILSIDRIENPFLMGAFLMKFMETTACNVPFPQVRLLFHGTYRRNVENICRNNFDWRLSGTNVGYNFGRGVSFSPFFNYACYYSDRDGGPKVMLAALVIESATALGFKNTVYPPPGFDTTKKPSGQVVVKYEDNEFYPLYVISYCYQKKYMNNPRQSNALSPWL